jgi:hypothetical protein
MESVKFFIFLVVLLSVYINSKVIAYLYNLEDIECECALLPERNYILLYTIYSVILTFMFLFVALCYPNMLKTEDLYLMTVVNKFLSFVNVIITIIYLNKLRKCPCSKSPYKDLMFYMSSGAVLVYIFNIIFGNC